MATLHYEFESDDAQTPRDSHLDDDQVVAGLYKDVDIDIDDRFSAPVNSKPDSVPSKSSGIRNFNFSIPIHTQKLNEQKAFSAQLFNISKPGVEPATAVQSGSTKMESPTFCKGGSELISPSFPAPAFDDQARDNKLLIKPGLLSDSDIKSPASQESIVKQASANKQEQKPRLSGTLQEAFGRKSQNSQGSSKTNIVNPGPEYGISKPTLNLYAQKSDRGGSNRSAGVEKKDSNQNKVSGFFFADKNNGLNNELQRPESTPDVDKSRNASSAIQTSRTVGVEMSYLEHADPLSLGNFDQKIRSKPVSSQISSRKTLREAPKPAAEGHGLASSNSNSNLKTAKTLKKEERPSQAGDNRTSLYKKIMAQGKTPKEIDVQQAAPADFRPKVEKVAKPVTPTRLLARPHTPKMVGAENVLKQQANVSNTDHSLKAWKVQGEGSSPKRNTSAIEANVNNNGHHKTPSQSNSPKRNGVGGNGFFREMVKYHTLNVSSPKSDSPKMKSSNSQKTFNSIASSGTTLESSPGKITTKQESNRIVNNATTNKATEQKRARANTAQQTTLNKSAGTTTPKNGRQPSKSPKAVQQRLYQFAKDDEGNVAGENSPGKGQQLQVIEANLREIQGKNLMNPNSPKQNQNSPKHIRYPSFGSLEKDRRPSSRRTISQDSQSATSQQFANSLEKERPRLTPTPKSSNKPYIPLVKIEEVKEVQPTQAPKPLHDIKLSHSSLMKSLNLRKNVTGSSQESGSTPASSRSHRAVLVNGPSDVNIADLMPYTVHGGSQPNSGMLNKGIVDIYQRNSQWLSSKQQKIQQSEVSKKKDEMKECTFKPHRNIMINCESEYSQKNFNNYGIGRVASETNQAIERRSLSKEKRTLNSYGGIHQYRKEVMTPKPSSGKSPKSVFFPKREAVDSAYHYTNPH